MKKLKFASLSLLTTLLAACGSSNSGSLNLPETTPTDSNPAAVDGTAANSGTSASTNGSATVTPTNTSATGSSETALPTPANVTTVGTATTSSGEPVVIQYDPTSILSSNPNVEIKADLATYSDNGNLHGAKMLDNSGITVVDETGSLRELVLLPYGQVTKDVNNTLLIGQKGYNVFYGVWRDNLDHRVTVGYLGTVTTNVPTTGTATYKGNAFFVDSNAGVKKAPETVINVDFANKTVDGSIAYKNDVTSATKNIALLRTDLAGAEFTGVATTPNNDGGTYKGALFGEGATEAAGVVSFPSDNSLNAVFGAVKQ